MSAALACGVNVNADRLVPNVGAMVSEHVLPNLHFDVGVDIQRAVHLQN
jgi:hypothetical protein